MTAQLHVNVAREDVSIPQSIAKTMPRKRVTHRIAAMSCLGLAILLMLLGAFAAGHVDGHASTSGHTANVGLGPVPAQSSNFAPPE